MNTDCDDGCVEDGDEYWLWLMDVLKMVINTDCDDGFVEDGDEYWLWWWMCWRWRWILIVMMNVLKMVMNTDSVIDGDEYWLWMKKKKELKYLLSEMFIFTWFRLFSGALAPVVPPLSPQRVKNTTLMKFQYSNRDVTSVGEMFRHSYAITTCT
jgi:hypothetical protein